MIKMHFSLKILLAVWFCWFLYSCNSPAEKTDVVRDLTHINEKVADHIRADAGALSGKGLIFTDSKGDSTVIARPEDVKYCYQEKNYAPVWSDTGKFLPVADSLLMAIQNSADIGLDPNWYHYQVLSSIVQQLKADSLARYDALKWSTADMLLTDAFSHLMNHLHYGVLPPDSISIKKDSAFTDTTVYKLLTKTIRNNDILAAFDSLQPHFSQYSLLCKALVSYKKENADRRWQSLPLKYTDTALFQQSLAGRLLEGGYIDSAGLKEKSVIADAIKSFQRSHALYPDGVAGTRTIEALNLSKEYRIRQIAVNLERWRHLADSMPKVYVWVNIPSYLLTVWNNDTAILKSRVITGKPGHETPLLNSSITNFQLYPYWRVPMSIIANEMLPAIKRDTAYLRKHNLEVVDRHNNIVPNYDLHWNKYNKNYFPYVIRQMTGLDNSLGIIKFNFKNKYSVYLHDTNLRNLFNLTHRDLSHGCVRVQQWDSLARFLIRDDTLRHTPDSVRTWLDLQEQKWVALKTRVPVYIRYFTCEVNSQGKLIFFDDIYGYDSVMMRKMYY